MIELPTWRGRIAHAPSYVDQTDVCACGVHGFKHVGWQNFAMQHKKEQERLGLRQKKRDHIIAIDGEGVGRFPHQYYLLCASDEEGKTTHIEAPLGGRLKTVDIFEFLTSMPQDSMIVGYALGYDWTKILSDLPTETKYGLFHPDARYKILNGKLVLTPVFFEGFKLNTRGRRLTITKMIRIGTKLRPGRKAVVWDVFAFFQAKFVTALKDWKVAEEHHLTRMSMMKDSRANLDQKSRADVLAYCEEEVQYLAKLVRKLITAHDDAGLKLTQFNGAGSSASALLSKIKINDYKGEPPEEMNHAVACAFFGGRFENSFCGRYTGPVYNRDISSAYPYQICFLPCLRCGKWERVTGRKMSARVRSADLSLINWRSRCFNKEASWGPLPVRTQEGTILFPLSAPNGGWTWRDEYYAAKAMNPNMEMTEAWVYSRACSHEPFATIPHYYRERMRIGKDGAGIVFKLAMNACAGKLMQSNGLNPPYQSWVWGGNVTSGTRAQLLNAINAADDDSDVLMVATDGIFSKKHIDLPEPRETGTRDTGKPLGGWEEKVLEKGVFCVRPGIYFPNDPTEDQIKEVKARGVGKKVLYDHHAKISQAYDDFEVEVQIAKVERFNGAKASTTRTGSKGSYIYWESERYGEWVAQPVNVSFAPEPKRVGTRQDGSLAPLDVYPVDSMPYDPAIVDEETRLMKKLRDEMMDQPDIDMAEEGLDAL